MHQANEWIKLKYRIAVVIYSSNIGLVQAIEATH